MVSIARVRPYILLLKGSRETIVWGHLGGIGTREGRVAGPKPQKCCGPLACSNLAREKLQKLRPGSEVKGSCNTDKNVAD